MSEAAAAKSRRKWIYRPSIDAQMAPFCHWPPRFGASLRYIVDSWGPFAVRSYILALSIVTWFYFAPALERCREFGIDWIAQIWARNLALMLIVAGGLHLYLYTFRRQGDTGKYDPRELARHSKLFHFNNQTRDNMFWVLVSAVSVWTLYEAIMMWAYANGFAPMMALGDNPAWLIFVLFVTPWWAGIFICSIGCCTYPGCIARSTAGITEIRTPAPGRGRRCIRRNTWCGYLACSFSCSSPRTRSTRFSSCSSTS